MFYFSKRVPMTVTWSNFVNNTLIASRQANRRSRYYKVLVTIFKTIFKPYSDQGIINKVGPGNCHWGAFAEKCINNRTIRHDTKGMEPIVYCLRKMHLWESKPHAVYSIPLCF